MSDVQNCFCAIRGRLSCMDRPLVMEDGEPSFRYKCLASVSQSDSLMIAIEQFGLEETLKVLNLFCQCRLRNVQPGRRTREVQFFRNTNSRSHKSKVDFIHGPVPYISTWDHRGAGNGCHNH